MSTTAVSLANAGDILREGWSALVDTPCIQKTTRFVVLLERGNGDSVQELAQSWGDASIDEIHRQVSGWATQEGTGTA